MIQAQIIAGNSLAPPGFQDCCQDVDPNSCWLYLKISEHFLAFFLLVTSTFFDCLNPQLLSVSGTFLSPWMGLPATLAGLKSTKNGATPCWFEIDRSTSLQLGATRSSLQAFREA